MRCTGVFATKDETEELQRLAREAANTPVMLVGGADISRSARQRVLQRCHELALTHGLPEIAGYYGALPTGEFVTS